MPDQGALGLVKNLIDKDPEVNTDEGVAMVDAEIEFQKNVTERWKADMGSDVKLAKLDSSYHPDCFDEHVHDYHDLR